MRVDQTFVSTRVRAKKARIAIDVSASTTSSVTVPSAMSQAYSVV